MKKFTLKIIWLKSSIGLSIDHIVENGHSPLSLYFFWPRNDAWTQIKQELELKPWISKKDTIELLNEVTLIINYWQKNSIKKSIIQAKERFPDINFYGDY